jgi:hypothetical protein
VVAIEEELPPLACYRYADALPTAQDTLLVVEVADSSVRYDRDIKLPRYAQRGIPEVWIVDLEANLVRMHRQPHGPDYLQVSATATPGVVDIVALPGVTVDLTACWAEPSDVVAEGVALVRRAQRHRRFRSLHVVASTRGRPVVHPNDR